MFSGGRFVTERVALGGLNARAGDGTAMSRAYSQHEHDIRVGPGVASTISAHALRAIWMGGSQITPPASRNA
jgi:hypothetical protein